MGGGKSVMGNYKIDRNEVGGGRIFESEDTESDV